MRWPRSSRTSTEVLALAERQSRLGERADSGLIRAGCERAEVSAEFALPESAAVRGWLNEHDLLSDEAVLLLRRLVDSGGRSRAYLNGSPVTLQQLRELNLRVVPKDS